MVECYGFIGWISWKLRKVSRCRPSLSHVPRHAVTPIARSSCRATSDVWQERPRRCEISAERFFAMWYADFSFASKVAPHNRIRKECGMLSRDVASVS
jgi:hypothetical protein